jgi:ribosomal protein S12 methylthiotransferase accessory factor
MTIDLLELDPASQEYKTILAAVGRRHGVPLARVADLLHRVFLLRSEWAPGLRFVGAQARAQYAGGTSQLMSVGGCALALEDAFASCLGEAAERVSQVERAGDVHLTATLAQVEDRVADGVAQLVRLVLAHSGSPDDQTVDWLAGESSDGAPQLIPADWCIRRATAGPLMIPGTALSVGCAAGPDLAGARERALLELVERDAVSLWWDGGRHGPMMPFDAVPGAADVLAALRGANDTRRTALIDLTTEVQTPVVAAYSTDRDGSRNFVCGFAARTSLDAAAGAALMEMCQLEVGLQLAALKREQLGEAGLNDDDRKHLLRAAQIDVASDRRFAAPEPPRVSPQSAPARPVNVPLMLAQAGIEAALVDLSRPDIGTAVTKAITPELQLSPSRLKIARLRSAIEAHAPPPTSISLF